MTERTTRVRSIQRSELLGAICNALVERDIQTKGGLLLDRSHIAAWIGQQEHETGAMWERWVNPLLDEIEAAMLDDLCRECAAPLDGDGWDGRCGNCADRRETNDG